MIIAFLVCYMNTFFMCYFCSILFIDLSLRLAEADISVCQFQPFR